ncbi:peroxisomal nicotinamide adenine dinucleotide carrier-like isoform X2 [Zingiber officinale]|uniref:peroxisomal nicotinamide adenine dinucleotide carrier-like isoform X2 n=1 Tax=Zingiber officinale TaxID=94328 RepID=UPI001C4CF65F|nr:peroxisomal nicotinamide adenine dinucleotide carrier-like isoform X2 [Zingiber officinale]
MSNALVNGLAGAGGGIIAQIITYPIQTVNTRQQTERIAKKTSQASVIGGGHLPSSGGTISEMFQLIKMEGWGGLYSGLKPSLVGTATSQLLKNKAESIAAARKKKGLGDGTVGMFSWLVVAAIAGSLNVLLTNPIWVLVTRMQTHTQAERRIMEARKEAILKEYARITNVENELAKLELIKPQPYGTFHAVREVYNEAGIKGFWKGLIPTLIMVCNPSIQFMIYETSLKHLRKKRSGNGNGVKDVTALQVFLLGALAKLGATVVTYPLLVVKSRLQAKQEIGKNAMSRYTGTLDAILKMIRYEGLYGFYKGMGTKIVQSVFAASVLFMVKEELVKAFIFVSDKGKKIHTTAIGE